MSAGGESESRLEALIRRERAVVGGALVLVAAAAWLYVLAGSGTGMSVLSMTTAGLPVGGTGGGVRWTPAYAALMLAMWWAMMVAMMLPAAAPVVLLYAQIARSGQARGQLPAGPVAVTELVCGYLAIWLAFSAAATLAQLGLERAELLSGIMMWSTSRELSAGLLVAAGVYQLSPWKDACLSQCRSPLGYLTGAWRPGRLGAFRMGLGHGAYCLGCCWLVMALFFVGGAMNLVWMAGLTILVLGEKLLPYGRTLARLAGIAMLGLAAYALLR
jgi:predicted metal-binding membrane protein